MKCKKCNSENLIVKQEKFKDHTIHERLICGDCLTFQKWLPKNQAKNLRIMKDDFQNHPDYPEDAMLDLFKEINFKLDLILDHLGVKHG